MMKKFLPLAFFLFCFQYITAEKQTINVFDEILFYDGYASLEKLADEMVPVPEGFIRHKTSLYATKLTPEQLSSFGDEIEMEVIIKAACDDYDRIGNVNLALVPKGAETYIPEEVDRYELGRFITPFMNKNKQPDAVPYTFNVNFLKHVFKEKALLDTFDFWIELEVFGVPYSAQGKISGCANRNDVFYGTLSFKTSDPIDIQQGNVLIPLFFQHYLNNYQENATDELGKTIKSIEFTLDENLPNCKLVLITSNHGAEPGGEEYNRRWHYVYFDEKQVLEYKPGRETCEPFRKYNTMGNGIYGSSTKTPSQWQSFSNWCPGDVIDTRIIELNELSVGTHKFMIEVPEAQFLGKENKGYFPLSLYFLSTITPTNTSLQPVNKDIITLFPNPAENIINLNYSIDDAKKVQLYNVSGQLVLELPYTEKIDISHLSGGIYWLTVLNDNNYKINTEKIIKK